ncbi:HdeA/HdeB family chaperone [Rhodoblastus sp. 17X3]|uniref:HdeA/HdeB family chaperone n=1 Tax=Rhodoblastus sp. 17X3 TaxID=3047026 RepID=UPI0024B82548|nr:HdeA/HdeB family chaperone [Rhodoblastus sp. 17X3]MDI9848463.1 HdeA/HdeB family chaperone [Rhodoblastus sp. 17X3]
MKRNFLVAAALFAAFAARPASAQVLIQMDQITCQQFLDADPDRQLLIGSWAGGYYSASKNLNMFQSNYAKRNTDVIFKYCREHKTEPFLASFMKEAH